MGLKERTYSILLVSGAESFNAALSGLLATASFSSITMVDSVSAAARKIVERSFDCVLINAPLVDDPGIRFAIDCSARTSMSVLLLIKSEQHNEIAARVTPQGVFTLAKPVSRTSMLQGLRWMVATRERLRRFEKKMIPLEDKVEEMRLVNRAKWLLISELKMTEDDAHHYIEKREMDLCVSKKEVAKDIIKIYSC